MEYGESNLQGLHVVFYAVMIKRKGKGKTDVGGIIGTYMPKWVTVSFDEIVIDGPGKAKNSLFSSLINPTKKPRKEFSTIVSSIFAKI